MLGIWKRIPIVIRAVFVGLLVQVVGNIGTGTLILANVKLAPAIPWSVLPWAAYLYLYLQYLNGRWWPRSTADMRRQSLRARTLSAPVWRWSLCAGGLALAAYLSLDLVVRHLIPSPPAMPPDAETRIPTLTRVVMLLMVAAVAGIVEEASFRGYMQRPIEKRHGPVVAILVVSLVFGLAHYTPPAPGIERHLSFVSLCDIMLLSVIYGTLAYLTGSILPGIVLHATADAAGLALSWWVSVNVGSVTSSQTGLFVLNCAELALFCAAAVWAFRRLAREARRLSTQGKT